ncbi:MAG: hypothetical protein ABW224_01425 [Kibdelosporangium sp.]
MGADSGLWWSVWWPWVIVLALATLGVVVAAGALVIAWKARHRFKPSRKVPGFPFYLDQDQVEGLCRANQLVDLVAKEIQRTVGVSKDGKLAIRGVSLDVGKATSSEIVETYIEKKEAIDVVGVLLNALDDNAELLHVDLGRRTVERGAALERAMANTGETTARLRKLRSYVLVEGDFQDTGDKAALVYLAPIGDAGDGLRVRLECEAKLLSENASRQQGTFSAVCLGRVLTWDEPDLKIRPIAIFH